MSNAEDEMAWILAFKVWAGRHGSDGAWAEQQAAFRAGYELGRSSALSTPEVRGSTGGERVDFEGSKTSP